MLSYAVLLLLLGILLAVLEAFLPSGGVLGVFSAFAFLGSLVLAFGESENTGIVFLFIVMITVPVVIVVGLKLFPHTPIGKRMILKPQNQSADDFGKAGVSDEDYSELLGKKGKTVTPLRPAGSIDVEGTRYGAVSRCKVIDGDIAIVVVKVEGNNIVVDLA